MCGKKSESRLDGRELQTTGLATAPVSQTGAELAWNTCPRHRRPADPPSCVRPRAFHVWIATQDAIQAAQGRLAGPAGHPAGPGRCLYWSIDGALSLPAALPRFAQAASLHLHRPSQGFSTASRARFDRFSHSTAASGAQQRDLAGDGGPA